MVQSLTTVRMFPMPPDTVQSVLGLSQRFTRFNDYLKKRIYDLPTADTRDILQILQKGESDARSCSVDMTHCVSHVHDEPVRAVVLFAGPAIVRRPI